MVDIGAKPVSSRTAVAESRIECSASTRKLIEQNELGKGDVLATARIAGIMAAKKTSELIPLCHQISISRVAIEFDWTGESQLQLLATVTADDKTGVEMEALVAAAVSALTVYDMCKSVDREMAVSCTRLLRKTGGKSGDFIRNGGSS